MRARALGVEWLLARPWLVVALAAIAIALPVVALGELSANDTRERLRAARLTEAESIAQRSADVLSFRIRRIGEQFATLASTGRMHLAIGQRDSKQAELLLAEARALIGTEVTVLWAVDLSGAVVAVNGNFPPSTRGLRPDTSRFPMFAAAIRSGRPRHFETAPETAGEGTLFSDATFYIAVPTTAADGSASSLNGILVGLLPGTIVENSLGPFRDATEIIYTVDPKGQVIHRTGSFTAGSPLRGAPLGGDLSGLVPVAAALGGKAFVGEAEAPFSRARRIMSTAPVRELDTHVLVLMPPDPAAAELEATLAEQRSQRYGLVSLLLVGSALFAATASRTVRQRRALAESLEQQTAVSEVLKVISGSPFELQPVLDTVIHNAVRLCNADWGIIFRADGDTLHLVTSSGQAPAAFVDFVTQHPVQIDPSTVSGRAALERRTVHVPDVLADPEFPNYRMAETQRLGGFRTVLSVPMVREGTLIGVIAVGRNEVRRFSPQEIVLLETFAAQAVIAIENVRLFNETKEALEQQTAIGDVLRVISSSPTDLQPVLDVIAKSAAQYCAAEDAVVAFARDGELRVKAHHGPLRTTFPDVPIDRTTVSGRSIIDRHTIQVPDLLAEPETEYPLGTARARELGYRTTLATPLLRDGRALGAIMLRRTEVRPFTEKQLALVRTFADQAVIAIENVRLFNETKEALEQQTAISEVLRVIGGSAFDLQPVLGVVVEYAAKLARAQRAVIYRLDGDLYRYAADFGASPELIELNRRNPLRPGDRGTLTGRVSAERQTIQIPDVLADPEYTYADAQRLGGFRAMLGVPIIREGVAVGVMSLWRTEPVPFNEKEVRLVETFAHQAGIAIENVRLFKETKEALEQQTATSEVLKVISSSAFDLQPMLDTVVEQAARLCAARDAFLFRLDDDGFRLAASYGQSYSTPELRERRMRDPIRPGPSTFVGALALRAQTIHIPDVLAPDVADGIEGARAEDVAAWYTQQGVRSILGVPLLRDGVVAGVIGVTRPEPRPFTASEIRLVETFADQSVIAIENVRLFNETKEALERQTATGEVLRAISDSPTNVQPVLDAIAVNAARYCRAVDVILALTDTGELRQRAHYGALATSYSSWPIDSTSTSGRAAIQGRTVHVADLQSAALEYPLGAEAARKNGVRAHLATPLLREGRVLGVLQLRRVEAEAFGPREVELAETFAAQAAIAIENVRLFNEIEQKGRQLELANRHKSEFLANMSHELRTPLNAIIGFSEVMVQGMFGKLNAKQSEYAQDILSSGRHLLTLINDILDLSKIEAGRMELELSEFSLPAALSNGVTMLRERATDHGIRLELNVAQDVDVVVADERKVKQVVYNLLSNAVKFTPDGGRVAVRAERSDGEVRVAVQDTGIGIHEDERDSIFEEFRQSHRVPDKAREGTGLGLTLSKKFVELHGGRIWVESAVGKGSTFTFTLPLRGR